MKTLPMMLGALGFSLMGFIGMVMGAKEMGAVLIGNGCLLWILAISQKEDDK